MVCSRCGNFDLSNGTKTLCLICKMDYRRYNQESHERNYHTRRDDKNRKNRERYKSAKAKGISTRCHKKPPELNKTTCKPCATKLNKHAKKRNDGKRNSDFGGCPWCGRPSVQGYKSCDTCLPKRQAAMLAARLHLKPERGGWKRLVWGRSKVE